MLNETKFVNLNNDQNINIHFCNNHKFKTNLIQLYFLQPLSNELEASMTALLPSILKRGSDKFPDNQKIVRALENLYGASLSFAVMKRGENQLLRFSLEVANEKFLPTKENIFKESMSLLKEMIFNPNIKNNKFNEDYFKQEKLVLANKIKSVINDKYSYAMERCFSVMCENEKYGIYKLGSLESLAEITNSKLYNHYQKLIHNSPKTIMVVGDYSPNYLKNAIEETFDFNNTTEIYDQNTFLNKDVADVKFEAESLTINQAKLAMGFRTTITRDQPLYYALLVYNGMLGGFPHSRLFQVVREKESLAYYVNSFIESTKGLLIVNSGIESTSYERVRELITSEMQKIADGNFTEEEFEWTKKALINGLKAEEDNNKGLTAHYLLSLVNKKPESLAMLIDEINQVSPKDVTKVANKIKLDTIYLLKGKED